MRISYSDQIEGGRIVQSIGRVRAASAWHAPGAPCAGGDWKDQALRALRDAAEDFEADGIIDVAFDVDGVAASDLATRNLQRVTASGVAVRLARR